MRLVSWNVNGLRAVLKKGFLDWVQETSPDLLCLQETKAEPGQLPPELRHLPGYHVYYAAALRKGYSGVGVYSRVKPSQVGTGFGIARFDCEGRILQCDYPGFSLLNIYFPNGRSEESRLQYKLEFYDAALAYFDSLRAAGRPVVICGDLNTAHNEIDLARPRENEDVSGFLRIERDWMDKLVAHGYVDSFRRLYPDRTAAYSWWSLRAGARARNVGWRLDYFFVSEDLWPRVTGAAVWADVPGSDHCPVTLDLAD